MHQFFVVAAKLVQKYRALLKKSLPLAEYRQKLVDLGISKRLPRDSVEFYQLLLRIMELSREERVAQQLVEQKSKTAPRLRFSGSDQSLRDMQALLDSYHIENGEVVHTSQLASRALVTAIQLMVLPTVKRDQHIAGKVDECSLKIAQYGAKEQHLVFWNSLKTHAERDEQFFFPLLNRYEGYLERFTEFPSPLVGEGGSRSETDEG